MAAAVEKFPFLGQPLILFGGLITIPFWTYNHTPSAVIEVMMADLPRVEYINPDKVTKEDIEEATRKSKAAQQRVKAHGLGANLGNRLNTNAFLRGKLGGAK